MVLPRRASQESFATLVQGESLSADSNSVSDDVLINDDLQSLLSQDTLINHQDLLMGRPVMEYTTISNFPVVSSLMQNGVFVFRNAQTMNDYQQNNQNVYPLLQTSSSYLSFFKKTSPFMIFHHFDQVTGEKTEFCKVYFKILSNYVTSYIFIFSLASGIPPIVMANNGIHGSCDFSYAGTTFRATGISNSASIFGNSTKIQTFPLAKTSKSLVDDCQLILPVENNIKNAKIVLRSELTQWLDRPATHHQALLAIKSARYVLGQRDVGRFVDNGNIKVGNNLHQHGVLSILRYSSDKIVENESLVTCCILLVLREQEYRKHKGNKKVVYH